MNLDAVGVISRDLQKTIGFYEKLGLSFKEIGPGHWESETQNGARLMIDSIELMKEINPDFVEPQGSGVVMCFKKEQASQVDQVFSALCGAGGESVKEPWDAFWGQRYASVKDPDGYQVDLFADL